MTDIGPQCRHPCDVFISLKTNRTIIIIKCLLLLTSSIHEGINCIGLTNLLLRNKRECDDEHTTTNIMIKDSHAQEVVVVCKCVCLYTSH